jgi:hypothetical protein
MNYSYLYEIRNPFKEQKWVRMNEKRLSMNGNQSNRMLNNGYSTNLMSQTDQMAYQNYHESNF